MSTYPYSATAQKATATLVKSGRWKLKGYHMINLDTTNNFVQFFDAAAASAVTVGTTTPTFVLGLPASGGAVKVSDLVFTNGIVIAAATTATGNGAPTNGVCLMLELGDS